jgi:cbb3-type cytochrome oxidase subunit 3
MELSYDTLRAICGTASMILFVLVFGVAVVWTYRPGAKQYYQNLGKKLLHDEEDPQ